MARRGSSGRSWSWESWERSWEEGRFWEGTVRGPHRKGSRFGVSGWRVRHVENQGSVDGIASLGIKQEETAQEVAQQAAREGSTVPMLELSVRSTRDAMRCGNRKLWLGRTQSQQTDAAEAGWRALCR